MAATVVAQSEKWRGWQLQVALCQNGAVSSMLFSLLMWYITLRNTWAFFSALLLLHCLLDQRGLMKVTWAFATTTVLRYSSRQRCHRSQQQSRGEPRAYFDRVLPALLLLLHSLHSVGRTETETKNVSLATTTTTLMGHQYEISHWTTLTGWPRKFGPDPKLRIFLSREPEENWLVWSYLVFLLLLNWTCWDTR